MGKSHQRWTSRSLCLLGLHSPVWDRMGSVEVTNQAPDFPVPSGDLELPGKSGHWKARHRLQSQGSTTGDRRVA
jgi:hypothetical protein